MAIPNFDEIYYLDFKFRKEAYFQPRMLFDGKSYCSIDFPLFKSNIKNLRRSMNQELNA